MPESPSSPGLTLGRRQERIVVVVSLGLPALLRPHGLTKHSVIQLLFSTRWKVANFNCFCAADFFKWNPCVWNSENKIHQNYSQ